MARGDSYQLQGQEGWEVITGSSTPGKKYRWLVVVQDGTEFDSIVGVGITLGAMASIPLNQGFSIGGEISSFVVLGGMVQAYFL